MVFGMSKANIRLLTLVITWYASSSMQNIWSKSLLKKFPHPLTLAVSNFVVIIVVVPMLMQLWSKRRMRSVSKGQIVTGILPLVLLKLFGTFSGFLTLMRVPISYAHTIKALSPIFTVSLSRLMLGSKFSAKVYLSLMVIVTGVYLTSATQAPDEFNLTGLLAGIASCALGSIQSIMSKRVMKGMDHLNVLLSTTQMCLVVALPVWFVVEGTGMVFGATLSKHSILEFNGIILQLLGASLCNCLQTVVAFTFLSLVSPVTYSVANVSKRLVVIVMALLWFDNAGSAANLFGMFLALAGVAFYNKVKLDEAAAKEPTVLPTAYQSPWKRGSRQI